MNAAYKDPPGYNIYVADTKRHEDARAGNTLHEAHDWFSAARLMELHEPERKSEKVQFMCKLIELVRNEKLYTFLAESESLNIPLNCLFRRAESRATDSPYRRPAPEPISSVCEFYFL